MNFLKSWVFCAVLYAVLRIVGALASSDPTQTDTLFHISNSVILNSPVLLIVLSAIFSALFTTLAYFIFACLDHGSIWYEILAFILGGVIVTIILMVVRRIYRQSNLKFLD
jgi:hypothetical protein